MGARYRDQVAIVTGGSSGIGAAIVARLVAEGARVLVADINPPDETGDTIAFAPTDVAKPEACAAMVAAATARFGRLDVLINNAGIGALDETPDMPDAVWETVLAVNLSSIFYACRAVIPVMRGNGGGAIVNVASIFGLAGDYGMGIYNASKAAAINYTRSLALDCARDGIRVNTLCPGAIAQTAMGVGSYGSAEDKQTWLDSVPLGRLGTPVEMANIVAFLASDEASFMTGSIVTADGGTTAGTGLPDVITQRDRRRAEQEQRG